MNFFRRKIAQIVHSNPDVSGVATGDYIVGGDLRLRLQTGNIDSRCAQCNRMMERNRGIMAYVSDGTIIGDSLQALARRERKHAYNGCGSGWCFACLCLLIRGAGGVPTIETTPPRPPDPPVDPAEVERRTASERMFMERINAEGLRKSELRHALTTRVLTTEELIEVGKLGIDLYIHMAYRGGGVSMSSQSYNTKELHTRLLTEMSIQTNLRMAKAEQTI